MEKDKPVSDHTETRAIPTVPVTDTHTPGPWAWYRREVAGVEEATELRSPKGQVLCIDLPEFIDVADKRLIAAAPDLLEALKNLVADYSWSDSANVPNGGYATTHPITAAKAAIAKAEGR
jgi:hypothetical protein